MRFTPGPPAAMITGRSVESDGIRRPGAGGSVTDGTEEGMNVLDERFAEFRRLPTEQKIEQFKKDGRLFDLIFSQQLDRPRARKGWNFGRSGAKGNLRESRIDRLEF